MAQGRHVAGALIFILLLLLLTQNYLIANGTKIQLKIREYTPGHHERLIIANHGNKRKFLKSLVRYSTNDGDSIFNPVVAPLE